MENLKREETTTGQQPNPIRLKYLYKKPERVIENHANNRTYLEVRDFLYNDTTRLPLCLQCALSFISDAGLDAVNRIARAKETGMDSKLTRQIMRSYAKREIALSYVTGKVVCANNAAHGQAAFYFEEDVWTTTASWPSSEDISESNTNVKRLMKGWESKAPTLEDVTELSNSDTITQAKDSDPKIKRKGKHE
jgi:hypothetical protein